MTGADKRQDIYISWDSFHYHTRQMAWALREMDFKGIMAVTRGGLVPAAILARELDIRLIDTICITSYDHKSQGEAHILKTVQGDGEGWLMIDDLVDTGKTARLLLEMMPKATLATIYTKPKARDLVHYSIKDFPQECWIHFPWDNAPQFTPPIISQVKEIT